MDAIFQPVLPSKFATQLLKKLPSKGNMSTLGKVSSIYVPTLHMAKGIFRKQPQRYFRNSACAFLGIVFCNYVNFQTVSNMLIFGAPTFFKHIQDISICFFVFSWAYPRMCDMCLAQQGKYCDPAMHYKNFNPNTMAWPLTCISNNMYHAMPGELSPWRVVPGWSLDSTSFDFMHNVFLGTGRDLVESSLYVLIRQGVYSHLPSNDMDYILAFLQEEMRHDCSACGFFGA